MAAVMSMTGFGSASFRFVEAVEGGERTVQDYGLELRSVNQRHAEVRVRMPWAAPVLEARIVAAVRSRCRRGRVELVVRRAPTGPGGAAATLGSRLQRVQAELEPLVAAGTLPGPMTLEAVARCAGLLGDGREDGGTAAPAPEQDSPLWEALDGVLDAWEEMRRTEGSRMAEAVLTLLEGVERLLGQVAERVQGQSEQFAERLRSRVEAVLASLDRELGDADQSRLLGEIALLVDRGDVTEELVRLRAHFAQVRRVLEGEGPHGRKLEFLLQEIHREVNTVGSKAVDSEVSRLVVAMKAELEKIREIVLNIE